MSNTNVFPVNGILTSMLWLVEKGFSEALRDIERVGVQRDGTSWKPGVVFTQGQQEIPSEIQHSKHQTLPKEGVGGGALC